MSRPWVANIPTKAQLDADREARMTREEMAAKYGVGLSTLKRWISDLDVAPRAKRPVEQKTPQRVREKVKYHPPESGLTLMEKAQRILGDRLTENRHQGYILDGRHASSWQVIKAAGLSVSN